MSGNLVEFFLLERKGVGDSVDTSVLNESSVNDGILDVFCENPTGDEHDDRELRGSQNSQSLSNAPERGLVGTRAPEAEQVVPPDLHPPPEHGLVGAGAPSTESESDSLQSMGDVTESAGTVATGAAAPMMMIEAPFLLPHQHPSSSYAASSSHHRSTSLPHTRPESSARSNIDQIYSPSTVLNDTNLSSRTLVTDETAALYDLHDVGTNVPTEHGGTRDFRSNTETSNFETTSVFIPNVAAENLDSVQLAGNNSSTVKNNIVVRKSGCIAKTPHHLKDYDLSLFSCKDLLSSTSPYPHPVFCGVRRRNDSWVCEVREPNKKNSRIWLGTYPFLEMAAHAHDVAAMALRGRLACLNYVDSAWRLPVPTFVDHVMSTQAFISKIYLTPL
ncbi:hypothetical protein BUALT_Bualt06G0114500 [Buddleja alternifolia]|uniref:AP2/ERF domain-containing protein n=1 Tax=Buddleja alternifolia TaxID=168488 RepID=A0AAV6XG01_9LAMI|nr:hypothetical protein BUALT_Bualt06G0114500 [Buddleja alternifolia]